MTCSEVSTLLAIFNRTSGRGIINLRNASMLFPKFLNYF